MFAKDGSGQGGPLQRNLFLGQKAVRRLLLATVVATAALAATAPTGNSAPATVTLKPVADAYTSSDRPTTNFGTSTVLRVDSSPTSTAYLRFDVQGLSGPVRKATLRVFSNSSSSSKGVDLRSVATNAWGETAINHNNRPAAGTSIVSRVGAYSSGQWISFDVTQLVTGPVSSAWP